MNVRMKARDGAREGAISKKLHELEQKHDFANTQYLKHLHKFLDYWNPQQKMHQQG